MLGLSYTFELGLVDLKQEDKLIWSVLTDIGSKG